MSVGVASLMWKRDVAKAFRKVSIKYDATDLSWVVFLHDGVLCGSQHLAMPFGSTSANSAWHRIGSLLKVIMVQVFLAPTCRYVDDFFGCDPENCMVTGGACLPAMCHLLGFSTDPGKDDDKAWDITVLGARIQLDVTALSVSAAVDANKVQRWTTDLRCMLKEKECSPDKAAKYAGRLAFTCTIAAGRQGRACVKPFYAQANAPLRGFDMSPALLNAASWWTKYLELKPSIRLAVDNTMRETVWAWTDASDEDPRLGVVVYARRRWYYTYLVAPPAVLDQLLHRQDSQINFLEMLAVLLFVTTFQDIICGTAAFVFIDNNSVSCSLLKGSSCAPEVNMLTGKIWLHAAEWSWVPIWARVESAANIADGPSRRVFSHVESIGAELVPPVLPQWLSILWILD